MVTVLAIVAVIVVVALIALIISDTISTSDKHVLRNRERRAHAAIDDAYKTTVKQMNIAADQEWRNWKYR
jgi:hypothetical protein